MLSTIDESFADSVAPNAKAIKNGRGLVLKNKLANLHKDAEGTILFGECRGSGKKPYEVSIDFVRPGDPTYRCSCPSRQFPCKHALGLLYAYSQGKPFSVAEVPADVAGKREKMEVRAEKKKERAKKPVKVNKKALSKKIAIQLEGLDLLENLIHDLTRSGLSNLNAKSARTLEEQGRKLKGDHYLPGAQMALQELTKLFYEDCDYTDEAVDVSNRDSAYSDALDRLNRLQSLVKKGRAALQTRLDDPDLPPLTESTIAAWLGHAWQLRELRDAGLVENDVELLQLAFASYDDRAREELVDTGIWANLGTGRIHVTKTYRPYKAAKFIKSEDSVFHVVCLKELCVYPGDMNPRIRWDEMQPRPVTPADYAKVRSFARKELAPLIKEVKAQLKTPLADRTPLALIEFARIGTVDDDYVLEDTKGDRIVLQDYRAFEEPDTCHLLPLLPPEALAGGALVGRFHHDLDARTLRFKPLTLLSDARVLRLSF